MKNLNIEKILDNLSCNVVMMNYDMIAIKNIINNTGLKEKDKIILYIKEHEKQFEEFTNKTASIYGLLKEGK